MVGKKKSTGLSRRTGFLDRDTIAEDRAIQRYNEGLEEEARRALRPANAGPLRDREDRGERGARGGRGGRGGPAGGGARGGGPRSGDGAPAGRPPRAPKPPAVAPEVVEALGSAAAEAGSAAGMAAEATRLVERLVAGAKFESAASAGWDLLVQSRGSDRTPKQWDDLRREWDGVRQAIGAVWAQTHPDDAPAAIKIRPPKRRRGGRARGKGEGGAPAAAAADAAEAADADGPADAASGESDGESPGSEGRKPRRRRRGGRGRNRRRGALRAVRPVAVVLAPGVVRLPRPVVAGPDPAEDVVLAPVETEVLVEPSEPAGPEVPEGQAVPPGPEVPSEPSPLPEPAPLPEPLGSTAEISDAPVEVVQVEAVVVEAEGGEPAVVVEAAVTVEPDVAAPRDGEEA